MRPKFVKVPRGVITNIVEALDVIMENAIRPAVTEYVQELKIVQLVAMIVGNGAIVAMVSAVVNHMVKINRTVHQIANKLCYPSVLPNHPIPP